MPDGEVMDAAEVEVVRGEVDRLCSELAEARFRHVAGLDPSPSLEPLFRARSRAAHRDTVVALRERGEAALATAVAALRAERAAASHEEAWRAAEAEATAQDPEGAVLPLAAAQRRLPRERDRERRRALSREIARAFSAAAAPREAAAETRARARAEMGLVPDWEKVVEADRLLAGSDDAFRDVLTWLARRERMVPRPQGDMDRADLLALLALAPWDGLFPAGMLALALRDTLAPLKLGLGRIRVDEADRESQWPGAHAFGARVSFRRQGGAADWLDLFAAAGEAQGAALGPPPHARDAALPAALGGLLAGLLLDPRFVERSLGVDRNRARDLVRVLALRRLFRLRALAAAFRVASEVERGTAGTAWRAAHRDALSLAALASWPDGLAARDGDAPALLAALRGEARAETLRADLVERCDDDWWWNPRAAVALAGTLAGRWEGDEPPLTRGAEGLVRRMD